MAETDKHVEANRPEVDAQPGQVITPGGISPPSPSSNPPIPPAAFPTPVPNDTPPIAATEANQVSQPAPSPYADVTYNAQRNSDDEGVSWTASEFIAHEKSVGWYTTLGLVAIVLAVIIFFLTKDYVSAGVILFGAFMLGVYGARRPRQLAYRVDVHGITIGQRHFSYEEFRSFAIMPEGAFSSIVFVPFKRFAPLTTIYYAPEDEDVIIEIVAAQLPLEERKHDVVDHLMRRIRF